MSDTEPTPTGGRRKRADALQQGPRKKPTLTDPLVSHGRHFGRVVHTFCSIIALITNGLLRMALPYEERIQISGQELREDDVFKLLLKMCPGLEDRLMASTEEEIQLVADLVQKGVNSSRADDTKGLKSAIVDWLTPPGQTLDPPINRKVKSLRGFHHERTGALLCPAGLDWTNPTIKNQLASGEMQVRGDQWPLFLYADLAYEQDDPWLGLLRNQLLVSAYKHVFTSPSSVDHEEPRATRAGNAYIHGMSCVTKPSLAYIATQVRFALSSASTFSRTDATTDSETFYNSIIDLLDDLDERAEVSELITWWNRKIFPHTYRDPAPVVNSALARIKDRRALQKSVEGYPNSAGETDFLFFW